MYREYNGQWKSRKRQIKVHKTIHRKLEIEQHEPIKRRELTQEGIKRRELTQEG
jgi:hypothetical protein